MYRITSCWIDIHDRLFVSHNLYLFLVNPRDEVDLQRWNGTDEKTRPGCGQISREVKYFENTVGETLDPWDLGVQWRRKDNAGKINFYRKHLYYHRSGFFILSHLLQRKVLKSLTGLSASVNSVWKEGMGSWKSLCLFEW